MRSLLLSILFIFVSSSAFAVIPDDYDYINPPAPDIKMDTVSRNGYDEHACNVDRFYIQVDSTKYRLGGSVSFNVYELSLDSLGELYSQPNFPFANVNSRFILSTAIYRGISNNKLNFYLFQCSYPYTVVTSFPDTPLVLKSPESFFAPLSSKMDLINSAVLNGLLTKVIELNNKVAKMEPTVITQSISFLVGAFTAMAFVLASSMRY